MLVSPVKCAMYRLNGLAQVQLTWATRVQLAYVSVSQIEAAKLGRFSRMSHLYDTVCPERTFSRFVCAHLTAHEPKLAQRVADYHHIVGTLLFPPLSSSPSSPTTMYATSHLFFLGDLNFRITLPPLLSTAQAPNPCDIFSMLKDDSSRERLKEFDQLLNQRRKGTAFIGLREGPFWTFKCTYKYKLGEVDQYKYVI
jgi:hypothetical protein